MWLSSFRIVIVRPSGTTPGSRCWTLSPKQFAFADQLKDDGRRISLGQARDLEVVPGNDRSLVREIAQAGRELRGAIAVADEQDAPGAPAATSPSRSSLFEPEVA